MSSVCHPDICSRCCHFTPDHNEYCDDCVENNKWDSCNHYITEEIKELTDVINQKSDPVNHPHHYENFCSIECIDAMELIFGYQYVYSFCVCNAWKYIWRYKGKNGDEDLKKARWYIDKCLWYERNCSDEIFQPSKLVESLDHWLLGHNIT